MKKRLGEMLKDAGRIDDIQLSVALGMQKKTGMKLGNQLLKLGFVSEEALSPVLKEQLGIKLSLTERAVSRDAVRSVPQDVAFRYRVMPLQYDGKSVALAMEDPNNLQALDDLSFHIGKRIKPIRALEWEIDSALIKYYLNFSDDEMSKLVTTSKAAEQYKEMEQSTGELNVVVPTGFHDDDGKPPGYEPIDWNSVEWAFDDMVGEDRQAQAELAALSGGGGEAPQARPAEARPSQVRPASASSPGPPPPAQEPRAEPRRGGLREWAARAGAQPAGAAASGGAAAGAAQGRPTARPAQPQPSQPRVASGGGTPGGTAPAPPQAQARPTAPPAQQAGRMRAAPHPPAPTATSAPEVGGASRISIQQALIDLLIQKRIITERELLNSLMRLESKVPEED